MTIAYFDCFAGAGGDMIVASLIDAGCAIDRLREGLAGLAASAEFDLRVEPAHRQGLSAARFIVDTHPSGHPHAEGRSEHGSHGHDHGHRHLSSILKMIEEAALPARAAERAKAVFDKLARAEANVHGCGIEEVHFHEVGAVDSIADIVGACLAMEILEIDRIVCSPLPTGRGTVQCDHGLMPVPAPATAALLRGVPVADVDIPFEAVTPTAAAILTALAEAFGPIPAMTVSAVGHGAGTREEGPLPNVLRVLLGEPSESHADADAVWELSANLDDCSGEIVAAAIEAAFVAGALDAWAAPVTMKKSRPGWVLSALCAAADVQAVQEAFFVQTTTFGVRRRPWTRSTLRREHASVETPYGPIRVKLGRRGERILSASPEFSDCQAAAESHHVSVREVYAAAQQSWRTEAGA